MVSNKLDRVSFWSLFAVITLLPIFILPFTKIPLETSKGFLLVIGLAVSIISWAAARFSDGKIVIPKSWLLISGMGIVLAFLLSALFSSTLKISFFGTMLDLGTFWFIFTAFLLMLMSSIIFKDLRNAKKVLFGIALSSTIVLVFQIFHLFLPNTLSLGILYEKTGNLLGSWNSIAVFSGLLSIVSILVLEFLSVSRSMKIVFSVIVALSLLLVTLVNFPTAWIMLGIFSLFVFIYKVSISISKQKEERQRSFPIASFVVVMVSLMFFVSGSLIGGFLPDKLGISNTEVRPSLPATLSVAKSVLVKDPILGTGPNKFNEAWGMYKSGAINETIFWNASFNESSGLIPTFVVTTGLLGTIAWLIFFILLLSVGFKLLLSSHKEGTLDVKVFMFYLMSLYLFVASLFYTIGPVLFLLAFAFLGVFIGLSVNNKSEKEFNLSFLEDTRKSFFAILILIAIMMISVAFVFKYTERFISVVYFQKAVGASSIEMAESNIKNAVSLYQNDLYLRTYAQIYLIKINSLIADANNGTNMKDEDKAQLQINFDQAIKSAQLAVEYNKMNYLNYEVLGSVYEAGVSLGATDAFDKAVESYNSAIKLTPLNPTLKFNLARLFLSSGKTKEAKGYAEEALSQKSNYLESIILLSQIAKKEGNNKEAISFAEKALYLYPQDPDLKQYLDSLRNSNSTANVPDILTDDKTVPLNEN